MILAKIFFELVNKPKPPKAKLFFWKILNSKIPLYITGLIRNSMNHVCFDILIILHKLKII